LEFTNFNIISFNSQDLIEKSFDSFYSKPFSSTMSGSILLNRLRWRIWNLSLVLIAAIFLIPAQGTKTRLPARSQNVREPEKPLGKDIR